MDDLLAYFRACLNADWTTEENGADWAIRFGRDEILLLFEHSRGMVDWMNNLHFHAVPYREMHPVWQCHAGFLHVWKGAEPAIARAVTIPLSVPPRAGGIRRLTVVGYSHGAALAVLCHEWLWYRFPLWRGALTGYGFGCPRVLYGCPPPSLAARWKRFSVVRNDNDPITHLPPRALGYCHVGNMLQIGNGSTEEIDAHRPESYLRALGAT